MSVEDKIKDAIEGKSSTNSKSSSKRRGRRGSKFNPQDEAETNEYKKGYRAGENSKSSGLIKSGSGKKNDADWYIISDQIAKDAANLNFLVAVGDPVVQNATYPVKVKPTGIVSDNAIVTRTPGIMTLRFTPTLGITNTASDPLNTAANAMYNFTLHANSGRTNYAATDFMVYLMAMDSIFMLYEWAGRVYGVLNNFDVFDRYQPYALAKAMGVSWDAMRRDMANFRLQLNTIGFNLGAFAVPDGLTLFKRHMWMCENIYRDAETNRAQYYMYNPVGFYKYQEVVDTSVTPPTGYAGGKLIFKSLMDYATGYDARIQEKFLTPNDIIDMLNDLIAPIWGSQSLKRISADILKAFTAAKLFKVGQLDESYKITPSYEPEVLSQFENAYIFTEINPFRRFMGSAVDPDHLDEKFNDVKVINEVTQVVNDLNVGQYLKTNFQYEIIEDTMAMTSADVDFEILGAPATEVNKLQSIHSSFETSSLILNFHKDDVSPKDIFVATRCASLPPKVIKVEDYLGTGTISTTFMFDTLGTETIVSADIIAFDRNHALRVYPIATNMVTNVESLYSAHVFSMQMAALISRFDWHPKYTMHFIYKFNDRVQYVTINEPIYDIDVFGEAANFNLENLNTASLLKELATANMGDFSLKA